LRQVPQREDSHQTGEQQKPELLAHGANGSGLNPEIDFPGRGGDERLRAGLDLWVNGRVSGPRLGIHHQPGFMRRERLVMVAGFFVRLNRRANVSRRAMTPLR
jgi:hypothetical protein